MFDSFAAALAEPVASRLPGGLCPIQIILIPVAMGDAVASASALGLERTVSAIRKAGGVFGLAVARMHRALVQPLARGADQFVALAIIGKVFFAEDALGVPLTLRRCGACGVTPASQRRRTAAP